MFAKGTLGRKFLYAAGVASTMGLGGGYVMYQRRLKENRSITADGFNAKQNPLDIQWALKHLTSAKDHPLTKFYRYTTCPWCGTVKAFLDCARVRHECVEVEPMFKGELAKCEYKKVPQLRFDKGSEEGAYLVDSRIIVDTLAEHTGYGAQLKDEEINKWRDWARGPLVSFITLEFNKSLVAAWGGYSYIDDCKTIPYANKLFLKVVGAPVMYLVALKVTKPRLIRDGYMKADDNPKHRLHEELNRFAKEALIHPKSRKPQAFHGGSKPDLVDLDTFGVLQSVRGHRVYNEIIRETNLAQWLNAMDSAVGNSPYTV